MSDIPLRVIGKYDLPSLAPRFDYRAWPEREQDACHILTSRLHDLHGYCERFESALALFSISRNVIERPQERRRSSLGDLHREWLTMAARDGGMSLYHFQQAIESAMEALHLCPQIHADATPRQIKEVSKPFRKRFPDATALRNAIGHEIDMVFTAADRHKNSVKEPYDLGGLKGAGGGAHITAIGGNTATWTTTRGRLVSYDLDEASRDCLIATTVAIYQCFPSREERGKRFVQALRNKQ